MQSFVLTTGFASIKPPFAAIYYPYRPCGLYGTSLKSKKKRMELDQISNQGRGGAIDPWYDED